jgi:hypothetical protein
VNIVIRQRLYPGSGCYVVQALRNVLLRLLQHASPVNPLYADAFETDLSGNSQPKGNPFPNRIMFTQWKGVEVVFKFMNHRTMQYEAMRAFKRPMYAVASLERVSFSDPCMWWPRSKGFL